MKIKVCPYLEYSFEILGKKWNGLIIHYLSTCPNGSAHFSEIKRDLTDITPRALSIKLTDLMNFGLIKKNVFSDSPVTITYQLTDKGIALTKSLVPVQQWAQLYLKREEK